MTGLMTGRSPPRRLPFPPLPEGIFVVVERALRVAWDTLLIEAARHGQDLCTEREDALTERLAAIVDRLRCDEGVPVPGFTAGLFETVVREGNLVDYSGRSIDKQPDLVLRLVGTHAGVDDHRHYGVFIEAKPVDGWHPFRDTYCENGIRRFVDGEYAWTMTEAMMLGYARGKGHLPETLEQCLVRSGIPGPYRVVAPTVRIPSTQDAQADLTCMTRHDRGFRYAAAQSSPGAITLRHVWLATPQPCRKKSARGKVRSRKDR
jgi:hypothetical protein